MDTVVLDPELLTLLDSAPVFTLTPELLPAMRDTRLGVEVELSDDVERTDHVVSSENAHRLLEAAAEPKSLWLVPGADHMSEDATSPHALAPAAYESRVTAFFDRALGLVEAPERAHVGIRP